MGSGLFPWKQPVVRLCTPAVFFPVEKEDLLETGRKFNLSGITALADFFRYRDSTGSKGDVPEAQRGHFAETEGCAVGDGKLRLVLQILCAEDQLHNLFF